MLGQGENASERRTGDIHREILKAHLKALLRHQHSQAPIKLAPDRNIHFHNHTKVAVSGVGVRWRGK